MILRGIPKHPIRRAGIPYRCSTRLLSTRCPQLELSADAAEDLDLQHRHQLAQGSKQAIDGALTAGLEL